MDERTKEVFDLIIIELEQHLPNASFVKARQALTKAVEPPVYDENALQQNGA